MYSTRVHMAILRNANVLLVLLCVIVSCSISPAWGRPATFLQDFMITWADSHIRQLEGGRAIQLVLDQNSGILYYVCNPLFCLFPCMHGGSNIFFFRIIN